MRAWQEYQSCCRMAAPSDSGAACCPECGRTLLRCPARGCGELVTPLGVCPACVDLHLSLDPSAVLEARAGECLSVPFVLSNHARVRSLSIKTVLREGSTMPADAVPLTWEQLEPGGGRRFDAEAGPFARGGVARLRLTIVASTKFDDIEEIYAFTGAVAIDVQAADPTRIVQHFDLSGADFGTAGMVVANPHASAVEQRRRRAAGAATSPVIVALERAERFELQHGYRGYGRLRARVPRDAAFLFTGFPAGDAPAPGPLLRPILRCGRNRRPGNGQPPVEPNDLCLRIYEPSSGGLDADASREISRRACDFLVQNDRLYVRSLADRAIAVNGEPLVNHETRIVEDGDLLRTPAGGARALVLRTTFTVSSDLITQIHFQKAPS